MKRKTKDVELKYKYGQRVKITNPYVRWPDSPVARRIGYIAMTRWETPWHNILGGYDHYLVKRRADLCKREAPILEVIEDDIELME